MAGTARVHARWPIMRLATNLIIILASIAICVAVYFATGGRFVFFLLPLLFGLPFLTRRRDS